MPTPKIVSNWAFDRARELRAAANRTRGAYTAPAIVEVTDRYADALEAAARQLDLAGNEILNIRKETP